MSAVLYRPARAADLPAAIDLFLAAVADMTERHGLEHTLPPRAGVEVAWAHVLRTGICHVAEQDGRLVAICYAIVRDRLWFLSSFWTRPDVQRGGIGGPLLRAVWQAGVHAGADTFFVWASPDLTAVASYLKIGMLPGYQIFTFVGAPAALPTAADYKVEPLTLATAAALDAELRGTRRAVDHNFWLAQPQMQARQVVRAGRVVGYYYVAGEAVGPAGWLAPEDAAPLLALASRTATEQSGACSLRVPGSNHAALRFAFAHGFKLTALAHLFTTAPFGRLEQYLASGPVLF